MENEELKRNLKGLFGGALAALVVVKGIIAIVPDAILLDKYGDIQGIFQLGLGLIAIWIFGATWMWLDGID